MSTSTRSEPSVYLGAPQTSMPKKKLLSGTTTSLSSPLAASSSSPTKPFTAEKSPRFPPALANEARPAYSTFAAAAFMSIFSTTCTKLSFLSSSLRHRAYMTSMDSSSRLHPLSPKNGVERWKYEADAPYSPTLYLRTARSARLAWMELSWLATV